MELKTEIDNQFIRNDQYNFIHVQINHIIHAHSTVQDKQVIEAVTYSAIAKVKEAIPSLTKEQDKLLSQIADIMNSAQADSFLSDLKQYVIPFRTVTEKSIKKLFPKAKKLQLPAFEKIHYTDITYLGWNDTRSAKKYLIFEYDDELKGIAGTFQSSNKKGICTLCNNHSEIGLFVARAKSGKETYVNRGNYICKDIDICNQNMTSLDKLNGFVSNHLKD